MKMKPFMPMSTKVREEMEKSYSHLISTQETMLSAAMMSVGTADMAEKKRLIFQGLRSIESFMSAELSKLRNKPKRATKFSLYMKRVITLLKIGLDSLSDENQVEAYPTLGLICTHFVNIILPSSLSEREPPKFIACNLYSFLKTLFSADLEYVLDVLICSNVFDDAESNKSVGYFMLTGTMLDHHLYAEELPSLTKYLTILAFVKESLCPDEETLGNVLKYLQSNNKTISPLEACNFMKSKFNIKFGSNANLNWRRIIEKIKTRKVVNITRKKRLFVVSGKEKKIKSFEGVGAVGSDNKSNDVNNGSSKVSSARSSPVLFYFDSTGQRDRSHEVSSSTLPNEEVGLQSSIGHEEQTNSVVDYSPSYFKLETRGSGSDAQLCILPPWIEDDEELKDSDPSVVAIDEHARSSVDSFNFPHAKQKSTKTLPKPNSGEKCGDSSDNESHSSTLIRNISVQPGNQMASSDDDDSDDLQVVFEDYAAKKLKTKNYLSDNEESGLEERDFADPESGEDEVPNYHCLNRNDGKKQDQKDNLVLVDASKTVQSYTMDSDEAGSNASTSILKRTRAGMEATQTSPILHKCSPKEFVSAKREVCEESLTNEMRSSIPKRTRSSSQASKSDPSNLKSPEKRKSVVTDESSKDLASKKSSRTQAYSTPIKTLGVVLERISTNRAISKSPASVVSLGESETHSIQSYGDGESNASSTVISIRPRRSTRKLNTATAAEKLQDVSIPSPKRQTKRLQTVKKSDKNLESAKCGRYVDPNAPKRITRSSRAANIN